MCLIIKMFDQVIGQVTYLVTKCKVTLTLCDDFVYSCV